MPELPFASRLALPCLQFSPAALTATMGMDTDMITGMVAVIIPPAFITAVIVTGITRAATAIATTAAIVAS